MGRNDKWSNRSWGAESSDELKELEMTDLNQKNCPLLKVDGPRNIPKGFDWQKMFFVKLIMLALRLAL